MSRQFNESASEVDETKSITSTNGLRNRSILREYTTEDCFNILSSMGLGYTPDQASKKAISLTENIKSVELLDPRKMTTGSEKLSDVQIGRNMFEAVRNMIAQGSEPLIATVKTNYPLEVFLSDIQSRMFELEESISQLEESYTEPVEPKTDRLTLRMDVDIQKKDDELRLNAYKDFQERTSKNNVSQPTEPPKTRTRSRRINYDTTESEAEAEVEGVPAETWPESVEYKFYQAEAELHVKKTTLKYKEDILLLYNKYDRQVEEKEQVTKQLRINRDNMRRQQVLEIFVSELQKQCNIVVQKLKTALMSYSFIREKLAQNVIVNGESIVQPLATENLSGIYALLHQEYNKITMGAFCDYLMALMSESSSKDDSNRNPQLQLKRMDKHIKTWLDMDLEKFMTPDHLFTICLLRSYHPDTIIRSDGVRHILEYSRRLESDSFLKSSVGEYANMPLYTELARWINDVHVKSMQFSSSSNTNTTSNRHIHHVSTSSSTSDRRQSNMELAAAANDSSVSNVRKFSSKIPAIPPNVTYATGPYDGEVLFNRNLYAKSGFRYQALLNRCVSCPHQPKCYSKKCSKCNYWGHNDNDCCQVIRKDDTRQR